MAQITHHKTHDTPQDKERLKITPLKQEIQDKEQHRRATASHRKAIPKEHDWEYQEGLIEDYDYDNVTWRYGWIGQQPSSDLSDLTPATLGVFASSGRF